VNKTYYFLLLLWLCSFAPVFAQTADIKGFLYNKETGEPLIYTNVFLKGTKYGVASDANGYFHISRIPAGRYVLMATQIGYDTLQEPLSLTPGQILTRKLFLNEMAQELKTVEIEGTRSAFRRENTVNVALTQITPREIKLTASVGGETDLAQYIQTVPGVVSSGDQGGQVFIRGGTLSQNLTLLDGMVIYNPFHSIGMYSILWRTHKLRYRCQDN
jgi:CarboxypepD_reg-like domain/TonB-dependent Receptor Plug Domain